MDFELSDNPRLSKIYLRIIEGYKDMLIVYDNFLMNLCVIPRDLYADHKFDESISPEDGTGYED